MDLSMPVVNGFEASRRIGVAAWPVSPLSCSAARPTAATSKSLRRGRGRLRDEGRIAEDLVAAVLSAAA
jgi:hypothetical protein